MRTSVLLATGAGLLALSLADAAYRTRNWGASDGEVRAVLAGDDLVPPPADVNTVAVGIDAPAEDVWRALSERLGVPATGRELEVGDETVAFGATGSVALVDPGRSLVVRQGPDVVRSFHLVPISARRCRLLARSRAGRGAVVARALDPVSVVAARRLLLAVAASAERAAAGSTSVG